MRARGALKCEGLFTTIMLSFYLGLKTFWNEYRNSCIPFLSIAGTIALPMEPSNQSVHATVCDCRICSIGIKRRCFPKGFCIRDLKRHTLGFGCMFKQTNIHNDIYVNMSVLVCFILNTTNFIFIWVFSHIYLNLFSHLNVDIHTHTNSNIYINGGGW